MFVCLSLTKLTPARSWARIVDAVDGRQAFLDPLPGSSLFAFIITPLHQVRHLVDVEKVDSLMVCGDIRLPQVAEQVLLKGPELGISVALVDLQPCPRD